MNRDAEVHELHPLSAGDGHIAGECHECELIRYAPFIGGFSEMCEHDVGVHISIKDKEKDMGYSHTNIDVVVGASASALCVLTDWPAPTSVR